MAYTDDKQYFAAYTYGLERIEVEALDETRPESQDPLYYLYDGLGSVAYMVKPDGNVRDHYNYDEYGKPAPGNSKLSPDGAINLHNTFGYTGEMWDEESKLLYLRARYYEPETGRFLSQDTYQGELENPLSRHLYAYVENNPVNYADPTGNTRLFFNAQPTKIGIRNVKGKNAALLRDLADVVGATTIYYPSKPPKRKYGVASVSFNNRTRWYSQEYFYTENKRIYIAVRTFAENFGMGISWSGRGIDQVVNLYSPNSFHVTINKSQMEQVINLLEQRMKYDDEWLGNAGGFDEATSVLGAYGKYYSVYSGLTIEQWIQAEYDNLKSARDAIKQFYTDPEVEQIDIFREYGFTNTYYIGGKPVSIMFGGYLEEYARSAQKK